MTLSWKWRDERQWCFEILDTGPGLAAEPLAARMAQATSEARAVEDEQAPNTPAPLPDGARTPETGAGEGIGLSIVRRLCELLDATLELDSSEREGTRFRVVLPVSYA